MSSSDLWSDLLPRVISAVLMAIIGIAAIWLGGIFLDFLLILVVAVMHWELGSMLNPMSKQAKWFSAFFGAFALYWALGSESMFGCIITLLLGAAVQIGFFFNEKRTGFLVSLAILLCGYFLHSFRLDFGVGFTFWLVGLVIATDLGGYFGGRLIGGPKLIPRVSPKKTWSGAVAGWIGALSVSVLVLIYSSLEAPLFDLLTLTVFISVASQAGDICESALKRTCSIKDSSSLIPGHGGVMDRFDGLVGASLVLGIISPLLVSI
jgi:phosphatidate cytidylyltransferase